MTCLHKDKWGERHHFSLNVHFLMWNMEKELEGIHDLKDSFLLGLQTWLVKQRQSQNQELQEILEVWICTPAVFFPFAWWHRLVRFILSWFVYKGEYYIEGRERYGDDFCMLTLPKTSSKTHKVLQSVFETISRCFRTCWAHVGSGGFWQGVSMYPHSQRRR